MATGRTLVLRFFLPASGHPDDVLEWIAQMLTSHSGVKVEIEPSSPDGERSAFDVVSNEPEGVDLVRSAWRDNHYDWRETGAELCC